jgi:hypothetical protein
MEKDDQILYTSLLTTDQSLKIEETNDEKDSINSDELTSQAYIEEQKSKLNTVNHFMSSLI